MHVFPITLYYYQLNMIINCIKQGYYYEHTDSIDSPRLVIMLYLCLRNSHLQLSHFLRDTWLVYQITLNLTRGASVSDGFTHDA